jgi:hypothetical protein
VPGWLKRFILWDYPRASWQYDVMVGVILAFIFLTPRSWFRDQQRMPQASQVTLLGGGHGNDVLWIDPELLAGVPENQRVQKLADILKSRPEIVKGRMGKKLAITHVEPILDSEGEVQGYWAFANP